MKEIINSEFYKKHEKLLKKIFIIVIIFVVLLLIWLLFLKNFVSFKNMEKEMTSAGRLYFEKNLNKYPKEVGDISSVDLQELYDRKLIASLYIPGKKELCSSDNSNIKVKKTKSGYEFYTYLDCGNYKSNTDSVGPEITLNGNDEIILEYGSEYKELGVKSVEDDVDGKLDSKDVSVSGKVDSTKVGTYKIKYVAYDSLKNKTIKYRKVKVIKTLSYITKEDTKDNIYKGNNVNNYVLYSGVVWRIVKANDDGTVKLITNDSLANISYSTGVNKDGYVYNWLNNYFYKKLFNADDYIVNSKWCNDIVSDINYNGDCKEESKGYKVGLISLSEYNNSINNNDTYLDNGMTFWTMTKSDDNNAYANHNTYSLEKDDITDYNGVRPVINVKKGMSVESGNGTYSKPYVLEGYNYGKTGKSLNTRYAGEYVKYSGYLWRIMDIDDDGNIQVVMDNVLNDGNGNNIEIGYGSSYDGKVKKFNVKSKDNIGYKLNNVLKDYLITKKMVKGIYEVNYYKDGLLDSKAKNSKVESLLTIPDVSEIFSLGTSGYGQGAYYIRNTLDSKDKILVVNSTSQTDEFYSFVFEEANIKVVTKFNKDSLIKSGKGTISNPYELR